MTAHPEAALQRQAAWLLDEAGLVWTHPYNEFTAHDARMSKTGKRWSPAVKRAQAEGMKSGAPDCMIFSIPTRPDCRMIRGVDIELKIKPNGPTEAQILFMADLAKNGHATLVHYSLPEVLETLRFYWPDNAFLKGVRV